MQLYEQISDALSRLNGQDVRQARLLDASRSLFTDARGRLSDRLLEMLDDGRQVELTHYLSQQVSLTSAIRAPVSLLLDRRSCELFPL